MNVPGLHNVSNARAAIAVARHENIDFETISHALSIFKQSKRRYAEIFHKSGAVIVHDYAHHPTEILATLSVAKERTNGKLIVVFEPHTYSRTQYLWKEFCACFNGVDKVIFTPIYPARERSIFGITSENLAKAVQRTGVDATSVNSFEQAANKLQPYLAEGNTILILGAGTIVHLAEEFGLA